MELNTSYIDEMDSLKENSIILLYFFLCLYEANSWDSVWEFSA